MPKLEPPRNKLLAALSREEYKRLLPNLETMPLKQNEILFQAGAPIRYAYFPERGLVSLLAALKNGNAVEVAFVGNRGLLGVNLALGSRTHLHTAVTQIGGTAARIRADAFLAEFRRAGTFQKLILNYTRLRLLTISNFATCNYFHPLQRRFARLLLDINDEVGAAEFPMTHRFMGQILGAARSEVAKTAAWFRRMEAIDYQRSKITIVSRKTLEAATCECYWTISDSNNLLRRARTK